MKRKATKRKATAKRKTTKKRTTKRKTAKRKTAKRKTKRKAKPRRKASVVTKAKRAVTSVVHKIEEAVGMAAPKKRKARRKTKRSF